MRPADERGVGHRAADQHRRARDRQRPQPVEQAALGVGRHPDRPAGAGEHRAGGGEAGDQEVDVGHRPGGDGAAEHVAEDEQEHHRRQRADDDELGRADELLERALGDGDDGGRGRGGPGRAGDGGRRDGGGDDGRRRWTAVVRSRTVMAGSVSDASVVGRVGAGTRRRDRRRPSVGRVRRAAGEGEEHLVERRAAQADVVERDALVGEAADGVGEAGGAVARPGRRPAGSARRPAARRYRAGPGRRRAAATSAWSRTRTSIMSRPACDFSSLGVPVAIARP